MYYITQNNQQKGPFSSEHVIELLKSDEINGDTPIWAKEFTDWKKISETEFANYLPKTIPPIASNDYAPQPPTSNVDDSDIANVWDKNVYTKYASIWSINGTASLFSFQPFNLYTMTATICLLPFFDYLTPCRVLLLIGYLSYFWFIYSSWKSIPPKYAQITPEKAVLYHFIPFFNFYWIFFAYKGLADNMNMALTLVGKKYRVSSGLCLASCIYFMFILLFFFLVLTTEPSEEDIDAVLTTADFIGIVIFWLVFTLPYAFLVYMSALSIRIGTLELEQSTNK